MLRAPLHEQEIREAIGVPGEGDLVVEGLAPLGAPEDRCVYFLKEAPDPVARAALAELEGCIIIVPDSSALAGQLEGHRVLETSDPRAAIARVLEVVRDNDRQEAFVESCSIAPDAAVSPLAVLDGAVEIGADTTIEPFCVVGPEVSIGPGCVLGAGARVGPRVAIGAQTTIGANAVIGSDGFGFVRDPEGNKVRIPHLAGVVIGSNVEISPLVVVAGGVLMPTRVDDRAKIGDLTIVGHGAHVERGASVVGAAQLGGSSEIGENAWIGMNASVREGLRIGSDSLVGMDASVQEDLPDAAIARAPGPELASRPAGYDPAAIGFAGRKKDGPG